MIIVTLTTTVFVSVAVTITITSIIASLHIIMTSTIITIIVTFIMNRTMNATIITASYSASIVASTCTMITIISTSTEQCTQLVELWLSSLYLKLVRSSAPLLGLQDFLLPLQKPGLASGVCPCTYLCIHLVHI